MNSKNLKGLCEAYGGIYATQELTEEQVWEEVETWVNSLIEEGYDLSDYTWEEIYEAYLEEAPKKYTLLDLIGKGAEKVGQSLSKGAQGWQKSAAEVNPKAPIGIRAKATPPVPIRSRGSEANPPSAADARKDEADPRRNPAPASSLPIRPAAALSPRPTTPTTTRPPAASSPRPAATPVTKPKPAAPTGPAVGKLGSTSFERRTPTSAELRAAQAARAGGASPEKALQAAQKTNLPTTGPTPAVPDLKSVNAGLASFKPRDMTKNPLKSTSPTTMKNSYEWGSTSKLVDDIANLYQSVYEAKKVDQDEDGDNDFADVRIARLIASGVSKEDAIRRVKDKSYNEEVEIDEATRMRKELGKEGETATRKELASRSRAYQRSGSVDKTIATAEREADRTTARNRDETSDDYKGRMQKRSKTLRGLAANRRKSVRSGEGLRGYAAKVEGDDKDLQSARGSARSAGTLTPAEKKGLGEEFDLWVNALIYEGYDLSNYTWDEMIEIYDDLYEQTALEQKKAKEEALAARRARIKEMTAQGRVMTSSKRTSQKAKQSKERQRLERLERLGDNALRQITGDSGKVSDKPMGSGNPTEKEDAPEATRRLRTGLRRDDLGTAADDILKKLRKEK